MRILPENAEISGKSMVCGNDTGLLSEPELRRVRGRHISILFQNPDRALNPLYRISRQIKEPLIAHQRPFTPDIPIRLLSFAGCEDPDDISRKYPCQCSGGMNQRALLAVVTALKPRILIADEPTKGLDRCRVGDVADSLSLMRSDNRGILLITHDILLARTLADQVLVMYAGEVVESGKALDVLVSPRHPYTRSLLFSLPENGFVPVPGMSPALSDLPPGCRFAPRCSLATGHCTKKHPDLRIQEGWGIRCLNCC
jgi:peptide/nickel transport system ATP-binding protein